MEKDEGKPAETEPKLPRASVEKIIAETLSAPMLCTREVKDALLLGCIEFVHVIATESNRICEKEQKKTVTHEHIYSALKELGYGEYIEECQTNYKEYQEQAKLRPSRQDKFKESGLTQDELEKEQEELFRRAKLMVENQEKGE